jgi:hypothetical protein
MGRQTPHRRLGWGIHDTRKHLHQQVHHSAPRLARPPIPTPSTILRPLAPLGLLASSLEAGLCAGCGVVAGGSVALLASFANIQVIINAIIIAVPRKHRALVRCLRCLLLRTCTTPGPFFENVCRWLSCALRVRRSIVSKVLSNDLKRISLPQGVGSRRASRRQLRIDSGEG